MTVNSTRDFIPPEPFEGQNYKPRYARPSASLREELCSQIRKLPSGSLTLLASRDSSNKFYLQFDVVWKIVQLINL